MKFRIVLVLSALLIGCGHSAAVKHLEDGIEKDKAGDIRGAVDEYAAAVTAEPTMPEAHYDLGLAFWRLHHFDEAAVEFKEALRLRPGYIEASQGLSQVSAAIEARQASFVLR